MVKHNDCVIFGQLLNAGFRDGVWSILGVSDAV